MNELIQATKMFLYIWGIDAVFCSPHAPTTTDFTSIKSGDLVVVFMVDGKWYTYGNEFAVVPTANYVEAVNFEQEFYDEEDSDGCEPESTETVEMMHAFEVTL